LTGDGLLVLQLLARGYGRQQVAALTAETVAATEQVEQSACAATVAEAVEPATPVYAGDHLQVQAPGYVHLNRPYAPSLKSCVKT
jgi:hypothetical protein